MFNWSQREEGEGELCGSLLMINTLRSSSCADRKSEEQGLPESRLPEFSAEVLKSIKNSVKSYYFSGCIRMFRIRSWWQSPRISSVWTCTRDTWCCQPRRTAPHPPTILTTTQLTIRSLLLQNSLLKYLHLYITRISHGMSFNVYGWMLNSRSAKLFGPPRPRKSWY